MKPISLSKLIEPLTAGQRKRLNCFLSNLARDIDDRHFDKDLRDLFQKYTFHPKEVCDELEYLQTLKSSKDGKLFSQGYKSYAALLDGAKRFAEPNYTWFGWNRNYKLAKSEVMSEFSKLQLSEITYSNDDDIRDTLPKLDTHAGWLYIITGNRAKEGNLEGISKRYMNAEKEARRNGSFNQVILPGYRTQGKGHAYTDDGEKTYDCSHKTRLVAMYSMLSVIAECKWARPIQDAMAEMSWYVGGKDLSSDVGGRIRWMRANYQNWISIDYSGFDASISAWLIHDAFEIIRCAFVDVDDELFRVIETDFIEKNFVFKEGVVHSVKGVPSGSMFTQIVDSIVNRLMVLTFLHSRSFRADMMIMGDDNLVFSIEKIDPDDIASYLAKNFGVIVNADKTSNGTAKVNPEFLSREWRFDGEYREPHELVAKMMYPERTRDYRTDHAKVEEVLYAYVLTYNITMHQLMDVDKFLAEYPRLNKHRIFEKVDSRYLPGALAFIREYTLPAGRKAG